MSSAATLFQTLNLVAITCAALAGSTAARRRGLDPVGILCCAFITGLSGAGKRSAKVIANACSR